MGVLCIYAHSQAKLLRGNGDDISLAALGKEPRETCSDDEDLQTEFEFGIHPAFQRSVTVPTAAGYCLGDLEGGLRRSFAHDEDLQAEFESDDSTGFGRSVTMPAALGQQALSALPEPAAAITRGLGMKATSTPWLRQASASSAASVPETPSLNSLPSMSLESGCNGLPTSNNTAFGLNQSEAWLRQVSTTSTTASCPETPSLNSLPPMNLESGCNGLSMGSSSAEFGLNLWGDAGFGSPTQSRSCENSEAWRRQNSASCDVLPLEAPASCSLPQMTYLQADSLRFGAGALSGLPVGLLTMAMPMVMLPFSVPAFERPSGAVQTSKQSKMTRW